jgi:chemotaxis protein MotB
MADEGLRPIIVKRIKKGGGGHHGGAWKIAYADFVTAMMAFFLLMWLLGSTAKGDLNGISEYFKTPLKVAMAGGSGSGDANTVLPGGGKDLTRQDGQAQGRERRGTRKQTLKQASRNWSAPSAPPGALKSRLEKAIDANPLLKQFKNQLLLDITTKACASRSWTSRTVPCSRWPGELQPYTKEILHEIGAP